MKKNVRKPVTMALAMMTCVLMACGNSERDTQPEVEVAVSGILDEALVAATSEQQTDASEEGSESTPESYVASTPAATVAPTQAPTQTPEPTQAPVAASTEEPVQTSAPAAEPTQAPVAAPVQESVIAPAAAPTQAPVATSQGNTSADKPQTQAPAASTEKPAAPQPTQAPAHTHSWTETGRSSSTDCFAGVTTTSINLSCSCGETKTDTQTADSVCDWQWVGDWQYDSTGCIKFRTTQHTCVNHGTTTTEMPGYERIDEHDYVRGGLEPSCEMKGEVEVSCSKCGTYFPSMNETATNDKYPDGGGNGHQWAETSRRDLDEAEAAWYGENKAWATITCSVCGKSYNDVVDK